MADLDVAVINYNTKDFLKGCLSSIDGQLYSKLTIIDNGSSDGSVEMLKEDFPEADLIVNKENLGFARAANQAIKNSKADYVLVLNSDTLLEPGACETILDYFKNDSKTAAIGPVLLNPDNTIQLSGRRFPSFKDASVHAFFGVIFPNNRFSRRYKMSDWDRKKTTAVDWVSGAAMALRRQAAQEVGLFDERYFMYVEDMDICWRLKQAGYKVILLPETKVIHYIGQSSKQINTKMIVEFQKSVYRFFVKQNEHSFKRHFRFLIAIGLFFRGLLLILIKSFERFKK